MKVKVISSILMDRSDDAKAYIPPERKTSGMGTFVSPNAKDKTFALPNARNTNMLVSLALGDANFLRRPCTFHLRRFLRVG